MKNLRFGNYLELKTLAKSFISARKCPIPRVPTAEHIKLNSHNNKTIDYNATMIREKNYAQLMGKCLNSNAF